MRILVLRICCRGILTPPQTADSQNEFLFGENMCYTARLEHKGLYFFMSNCFGIGFDWKDKTFVEAVKNNDPRINEILLWAAKGEATKYDDAACFDGDFCSYPHSSRITLSELKRMDRGNVADLRDNKYLSQRARKLIDSFFDGTMEELAQQEKEKEYHGIKNEHGHVYLIHSENGLHKIGKARVVSKRLESFNTAYPDKLTLIHSFESYGYSDAEAVLHFRYNEKNVHGEWFQLTQEDIDDIKSIKDFEL
jgi:hypothetical protein